MLPLDQTHTANEVYVAAELDSNGYRHQPCGRAHMRGPVLLHLGQRYCLSQPTHIGRSARCVPASDFSADEPATEGRCGD